MWSSFPPTDVFALPPTPEGMEVDLDSPNFVIRDATLHDLVSLLLQKPAFGLLVPTQVIYRASIQRSDIQLDCSRVLVASNSGTASIMAAKID